MFYINKTRNFIKKTIRKLTEYIIEKKKSLVNSFIVLINSFILIKILTFYRKKILKDNRFTYKNSKKLPTKVRIDACNFCQLNCVQCPVINEKNNIEQNSGFGYLKFENFKKFIDDNPQIKEIELSNNGEIFLNPELGNIIKYAYKKKLVLTARNGVNLNTLSDEMAKILVKYRFRELIISIDAATPETYTIYQKGGDFNKVIDNIKKINKYKKLYNSKYPRLTYKFIVFGHNEHEIPLAKKLTKELKMAKIIFALNWNENYSPIKDAKFVEEQTGIRISKGIDNGEELIIKEYKEHKPVEGFHCELLFKYPQINWNGEFLGCCGTTYTNFGGNVFKEGFFNVLNNDKIIYAKKMLTDLNTPPREDIPCFNCRLYKKLKENNCPILL